MDGSSSMPDVVVTAWTSIVTADGVSFPPKGSRVRVERHVVERHVVARLTCLAGMQMKTGADVIEAAEGVLAHIYGIGVDLARPDTIELHLQGDDGAVKVVALPFGDALRHVFVAGDLPLGGPR